MKVIWSVIGLLVLLHGYFFVRYGSADPCAAAQLRLLDGKLLPEDPNKVSIIVHLGFSRPILACYQIALTGTVPSGLVPSRPVTR